MPAAGAADGAKDLDPRLLAELVRSLRLQNLSALKRFDSLAPQLRLSMGVAMFDQVRAHMDRLQFEQAANALETGTHQTAASA